MSVLFEQSGIHPNERVAVLVDGMHLQFLGRLLRFNPDYTLLLEDLRDGCEVTTARYFMPVETTSDDAHFPIVKVLDWLDYNGWKTRRIQSSKPNYDTAFIRLTMDALILAENIDRVVLVTNNPQAHDLIEELQRRTVSVTLASSREKDAVSNRLVRIADGFIELAPWLRDTGKPMPSVQAA